jgi:hypothetical protein
VPLVSQLVERTRRPDAGKGTGSSVERAAATVADRLASGAGDDYATVTVDLNGELLADSEAGPLDHGDRQCDLAFRGEAREASSPFYSTGHE